MKKIISILAISILALCIMLLGCERTSQVDQCMRRDLFTQCMKTVPIGPTTVKYNDWEEVVQACENAAYYQSLRKTEFIKPECRSH
jgi:hypothetical protein